jgi:hypothetical protein
MIPDAERMKWKFHVSSTGEAREAVQALKMSFTLFTKSTVTHQSKRMMFLSVEVNAAVLRLFEYLTGKDIEP